MHVYIYIYLLMPAYISNIIEYLNCAFALAAIDMAYIDTIWAFLFNYLVTPIPVIISKVYVSSACDDTHALWFVISVIAESLQVQDLAKSNCTN